MSYPPVLPLPLYLPNLPRETLPVRFEEHFDTQGSTRAQELLTELTLKRKRLNTYLLVNPSVESRKNVETLCNDYLSLLAGMVADPSSFSSASSPAPPSPSIPSPYAPSPNASSSSNPYATVAAAAAAASAPPPPNSAASSPSVSGNSALPLSRACAFTWTNFSIAGNPISYGGAGFEICSTLLNLGLWYLSIGKELAISEDPTVRDGNQRSAFEYFAMAAGVFDNLLKHSTVKTPGENSDLKQEVYEALSNVALAESQSITITRNESRSNPLLIASLCHDTYEKYSVATTLLCTANPNPHSKFVTFLQFKANFFLSKAYFYHGIHLRGSESLSRGLKSLETARLTLKEARRLFDTFLAEKPSSKGLEASEYLDEVKSDMWSEYHRTELELERERGAERLPSQADPLPEPTSKVSPVKFTSPAINSRFWNLEVYLSLKPHRDAVSAARIGEFNPLLEEPRSGCFPFRKAPCAKKTVVIAGGGIAGMTVAHELLEKGYDVTIFEAGATLGGKAGCEEYNSNLIRDHSIKNFSSYYYCMLETMKRIPFQDSEETKAKEKIKGKGKKGEKKQKERKSVFDNLTPYDHLSCVFSDGSSLDVDTSLDQGILATLQTFKELREKFSKEGTPVSKIDSFVLKHISLIFMCDQRKRKKLDNISYEEFLGVNFEERPDIKKLYNLVQVTAAAKPEGSALAAADQALKMYGKLYNPHKLKKTGNILNGTIQEKFIGPWQTHIQKLGGRVFTSRPVDKVLVSEHDNKKIDGFVLADGSIVKADHYVLAVPISKLKFIINNSGLTQRLTPAIPALTTVAGEKWGHSCHFALKSLPFGVTPTIVHAAVESPWSVVFYYITRDLWKTDPHLTDEAPVQLWITCSDAITPGVLFNKPYSQCTEKEFMEELLKQANFKDEDRHLIVDAVVGKGLNWWDLKNSRSYPGKVAPSDLPPTPIPTPESQPANSAPIYPTLGSTPAFSSSGSFRPIPQSSQTPSSSFESTRSSADQLYPKKAAPLTKEEKGKSKMEEIQEVHEDHGDGNKKEERPNRVSYMDLTEQFLKNGPALRGQRVNEVNPSLQIVCDDPLYARDVGQAEFDNKTDFDNLFIAGECTRTIQLISTMEKANESGKRCAYHICSADGKSYPTKKFEYHPLPLRFIRYIDAFFFHIFG